MTHWPHQSEVDDFYGDPRGDGDLPNKRWVSQNLVFVRAPWPLVTAWDFRPVTNGARVHKKCAVSLSQIFANIWDYVGEDEEKIRAWGLHLYAGGFNYRLMRSGTRLSMHSWGCAIDLDSSRNAYGDATPNFGTLPVVLDAFNSEGWIWGGRWKRPDGMHFQAARI